VSAIVWSCPECQADLIDAGHNLWCPVCERYWSFTLFMGDDDE
jgi:exosome complex RNA-binding protein Csl4